MIQHARRVGTVSARSTRSTITTSPERLRSSIARFAQWQRSRRSVLRRQLRAERVPLAIPILYREIEHTGWQPAQVVNLSETGILFGPAQLEPGHTVEVILSPPTGLGALAAGKQVCIGDVVRTTSDGLTAARFAECRFLLES
jgi:hypothetical protein